MSRSEARCPRRATSGRIGTFHDVTCLVAQQWIVAVVWPSPVSAMAKTIDRTHPGRYRWHCGRINLMCVDPAIGVHEGTGGMRVRVKALAIPVVTAAMLLGSACVASAYGATPLSRAASLSAKYSKTGMVKGYSNKFTKNTNGWCEAVGASPCDGLPGDSGTIVRAASNSATTAYAPRVGAQSGKWYAIVDGASEGATVCSTYPAQDESCDGPFTDWGNPNNNYHSFPKNGFTTSLDVYLDSSWAAAHPGVEFEWDTAVNQSNGSFGQDFIFTAQTGNGGFTIGAGNNTRSSVPSPSVTIGTSGWYRFIHVFAVDPGNGDVEATMSIVDDSTATQVTGASWVIPVEFSGSQESAANVGGPLYGWFPNENIPELPIDNAAMHRG
jgi:hypothetical protein